MDDHILNRSLPPKTLNQNPDELKRRPATTEDQRKVLERMQKEKAAAVVHRAISRSPGWSR
jgi:hypothetical protein